MEPESDRWVDSSRGASALTARVPPDNPLEPTRLS